MSTAQLGSKDIPLGIAVQRLIQEVINLQTNNGEITARLNAPTTQNNEKQTTIESPKKISALTLQSQQASCANSFDVSTSIPKFSVTAKKSVINFITKIEQGSQDGVIIAHF
jgi:hypothetical protein